MPRKENSAIYAKYKALADRTPGVTFVGRLATYKYYNMDQIVAQALTTYGKITGLRRVEATVHSNGNGNGNGHQPIAATAARAGVECTVNRVGDRYSDQLERNGHAIRSKDLERLADLGVRTLRYPILWERTAPHSLDVLDWSWSDERMESLRQLGIKPIVGLLHHGSGPRYTSL
ncbi:MAG: UDP-galactopyranose mutase, partial [Pyrinomonadaceae bacterium]